MSSAHKSLTNFVFYSVISIISALLHQVHKSIYPALKKIFVQYLHIFKTKEPLGKLPCLDIQILLVLVVFMDDIPVASSICFLLYTFSAYARYANVS